MMPPVAGSVINATSDELFFVLLEVDLKIAESPGYFIFTPANWGCLVEWKNENQRLMVLRLCEANARIDVTL